MIRRIVWYEDRDIVKWALIAAAVGLSMGYFAERRLAAGAPADPPAAEQLVEIRSTDAHGAS